MHVFKASRRQLLWLIELKTVLLYPAKVESHGQCEQGLNRGMTKLPTEHFTYLCQLVGRDSFSHQRNVSAVWLYSQLRTF
jgi:hypothetical protein